MRIDTFFKHHRLKDNPFSQEDAKEDLVFLRGCIDHTFHPLWAKIYGSPEAPSAAVIFGERGSGKTALRFQIVDHLNRFSKSYPDKGVIVIEYHDFNPFIDEFTRNGEHLANWELSDHMDAILSLATRQLMDLIVDRTHANAITLERIGCLSDQEKRDLMVLASVYDHSPDGPTERCRQLAKILKYRGWWLPPKASLFWLPYTLRWASMRKIATQVAHGIRVLPCDASELRRAFLRFRKGTIERQTISRLNDNNARYELLDKLLSIARKLGYHSAVVVIDRVDEPTIIKGDREKMFWLMRSIFDLKFLGQRSLGVKLLLPMDLYSPMRKNLDDNLARLDKQHLCPSLYWSGASLLDLLNARMRICSEDRNGSTTLTELLEDAIRNEEMTQLLEDLKIPRNVFKFMYDLIARHCQTHTEDQPAWKISRDTFVEARVYAKKMVEDLQRGSLMA